MSRELPPSELGFSRSRPGGDIWARRDLPEPEPEPVVRNVRTNAILFVATVLSVFITRMRPLGSEPGPGELMRAALSGWTFAVPFLSILIVHELGHYVAARIHHVEASLPYFLPLPRRGHCDARADPLA